MNFLSKLVALKPGKALERMIKDVMQGKAEGADNIENANAGPDSKLDHLTGISGRVSFGFKTWIVVIFRYQYILHYIDCLTALVSMDTGKCDRPQATASPSRNVP